MRTRERQHAAARSVYADLFAEISLLADLQVKRGDRLWLTKVPPKPQPKQVVLYLGCNLLRTAHLAQTVIDVFRLLGVDFIAVAGAAYCCGVPHHRNKDYTLAQKVSQSTVKRLAAFKPERVVIWCPSCLHHYEEVLARQQAFPFAIQHTTAFLAENLAKLPFTHPLGRKVALHYHAGTPQRDLDGASAQKLLAALPGLTLVDLGATDKLGLQCAAPWIRQIGAQEWQRIISDFMDRAQMEGIQTVATLYHSCHRELCAYEKQYPFSIENYISLVGRALGIAYEDKYKKYRLLGDEERILEDALPCVQANRMSLARAREAVARVFVH